MKREKRTNQNDHESPVSFPTFPLFPSSSGVWGAGPSGHQWNIEGVPIVQHTNTLDP